MKLSEPVPQSYYEILRFINYAMYANHRGFDVVILKKSPCGNTAQACPLFGGGIFDGLYARKTLFAILKDARRISADSSELWEEWHDMDNFSERYRFFQLRFEAAVPDAQAMIGREYEATSKDRKEMFLADFPDFRCEQDCGDRAFRSFDDNNFERLERIAHVYGFELHLFKNHIDYGNTYEPIDVCGEYREESAKCADHFLCVYDNVQDAVNQLHAEMEGLDSEDDADFIESNRKEIETLRGMYVSADEFIIHRRTEGNGLIEIKKRHLTAANIGESHLAILLTITD